MGLAHRDFAWDLHPAERHLGSLLREAGTVFFAEADARRSPSWPGH